MSQSLESSAVPCRPQPPMATAPTPPIAARLAHCSATGRGGSLTSTRHGARTPDAEQAHGLAGGVRGARGAADPVLRASEDCHPALQCLRHHGADAPREPRGTSALDVRATVPRPGGSWRSTWGARCNDLPRCGSRSTSRSPRSISSRWSAPIARRCAGATSTGSEINTRTATRRNVMTRSSVRQPGVQNQQTWESDERIGFMTGLS